MRVGNNRTPHLLQEEYKAEGLKVESIPFRDNQPIIDLIAKRPAGLMPILEDQASACRGAGSWTLCVKHFACNRERTRTNQLVFLYLESQATVLALWSRFVGMDVLVKALAVYVKEPRFTPACFSYPYSSSSYTSVDAL